MATKISNDRRNEILDVSELLFIHKGYVSTTINDILAKVGIAKGTFYYYFDSKESLLDSLILRRLNVCIDQMEDVLFDVDMTPQEKLYHALLVQKYFFQNENVLKANIQLKENAQVRQQSYIQSMINFPPIVTKIIVEGVNKQVFYTRFPRFSAEVLLSNTLIFDSELFRWSKTEKEDRAKGYIHLAESCLGLGEGDLSILLGLFQDKNVCEIKRVLK
ncbi:TetR/AcrR family transcriptional regulator [Leuconostoc mesenteroides]|uniref:TetR/AcrR family transcriptional regulator n=1 Tax=Leuconostoc mesenteroides TaxID=1245 RepID=UPI0030CBB290